MTASSTFLRRALAADALASGATGVLLAAGGEFVAALLGLDAGLTRPIGVFFIVYGAMVAWLASRPAPPRAAVWTVIALNAAWAIESFIALATGFLAPNALGIAFVAVQALIVGAFAELQFMGLRRSLPLAR